MPGFGSSANVVSCIARGRSKQAQIDCGLRNLRGFCPFTAHSTAVANYSIAEPASLNLERAPDGTSAKNKFLRDETTFSGTTKLMHHYHKCTGAFLLCILDRSPSQKLPTEHASSLPVCENLTFSRPSCLKMRSHKGHSIGCPAFFALVGSAFPPVPAAPEL